MSVYVLAYSAVSIGWAFLWIRTYKTLTAKRLILHTLLFTALSILVFLLVSYITFIPVDESYSASNIGALGFMILLFINFFGASCIVAFAINIGKLLNKDDKDKEGDDKSE